MKLTGLIVCVDYADLFTKSIDRWHTGLDRLLVITTPSDKATIELCRRHNVETHLTDIFYANGAKFNKGAALSEAVIACRIREGAEWLITIDADMVPPSNWREIVEEAKPKIGKLYGSLRYSLPESTTLENCVTDNARRMPQSWIIGFFSMFYVRDPRVPSDPMFETHWTHAGNFDTSFSWLWGGQDALERRQWQEFLPLNLIHLGDERKHWLGRDTGNGNGDKLRQLLGSRQHFHDVERERIEPPKMPK